MLNLYGARLKIERAKKHVRDLDSERSAFLGTAPYVGVPKFNADEDCTVFTLENIPPFPDIVSAILGDAAHNLRTALDYLACELVRDAGVEPKGVYFPIAESAEKYRSESAGKTKGMPQAAKDIIDKMHPYRGGNDGLWGLHRLDIIDKHRLLPAVAMKVGSWQVNLSPQPTEYNFEFPAPLEKGDIIGWIAGNREMDKRMSVTADIAFGEPEVLEGRPMIETLNQLTQLVEAIISHFETNYPSS